MAASSSSKSRSASKARAYLQLPSYRVEAWPSLMSFKNYLERLSTVVQSDEDKQSNPKAPNVSANSTAVCWSKFLHFERQPNADVASISFITEVGDFQKVSRFLQLLRDSKFSYSGIQKYLGTSRHPHRHTVGSSV